MQVKSLWLLFNSPFEADEVRRVLEHSGSLKLLGIKQTSPPPNLQKNHPTISDQNNNLSMRNINAISRRLSEH
jgi:hypothetical protein